MTTSDPVGSASGAATAVRPDGRPYRRKKPPEVVLFEPFDYRSEGGVLALRTHDDAEVREEVDRLIRSEWGPGVTTPDPVKTWLRYVPWPVGDCDTGYVVDEANGVPALEYVWSTP